VTKAFNIPKHLIVQAYKLVKSNAGGSGVDGQSLLDYENNLKGNLYKLRNRMSSGSYFPAPVKAVEIPKKSGGTRILGVPTVEDRIAQMTIKLLSHLGSLKKGDVEHRRVALLVLC
jgi:retron-type reverse transcriptase